MSDAPNANLFIIMGVSGSGKSTIGTLLAQRIHADFVDADDYHSEANKQKMHAGHALTDEDRWPWLAKLNDILQTHLGRGEGCVMACSALRKVYRERLQAGLPQNALRFVLLEGSRALIAQRLETRHHEYMNSVLLESQFATLEAPDDAVKVCNDKAPMQVVDEILGREQLA